MTAPSPPPRPMSGRLRALSALGAFAALIVVGALPGAAAGDRPDRSGENARGPLALAKVKIDQRKLRGTIAIVGRRELPPLRELRRFPSRLHSDERHLCVAADGAAIKRRLLCVGGASRQGKVSVGISRYRPGGSAHKVGSFQARVKRPSANSLHLEFRLSQAGLSRGRFRFFGVSSWRGAECTPPPPENPTDPDPSTPERAEDVCHSRAPRTGSSKGRIYKVVPVGCTTGNRGAYRSGPRRRKRVALTFDDGPSPYTGEILDALDRAGAKATFFQVGSQTGGYAGLMRRIVNGGHEIGNHSYSHEQYPSSSSMASTNGRIRASTGFEPCDFRPPYGAYNGSTVSAARRQDLSVALWDVDTVDYSMPGTSTIYSRAVQGGRGSIVLMHDGGGNRSQTAAAVPRIVQSYRSRGYELVTVTELLGGHFRLRELHHKRALASFPPARSPLLVPGGEDPAAIGPGPG